MKNKRLILICSILGLGFSFNNALMSNAIFPGMESVSKEITFNKDGGTGGTNSILIKDMHDENPIENGARGFYTDGVSSIEIPSKDGYEFKGYYCNLNDELFFDDNGVTQYTDYTKCLTINNRVVDHTFDSEFSLVAHWEEKHTPFYVEALEDDFEIMFYNEHSYRGRETDPIHALYSIDDPDGEYIDTDMLSYISVEKGHKIYFKTIHDGLGNGEKYCHFVSKNSKKYNVGGELNSLTGYTTRYLAVNCVSRLFLDETGLIDASRLIMPDFVGSYSFEYMFSGCTNLIYAPALPCNSFISSIGSSTQTACYRGMFKNCKSLIVAPALPATVLSNSCYYSMFEGCSSLQSAPVLPATTLTNQCYSNMFKNCSSLLCAPELPATTLTSSCYSSMFYGCSKLERAPILKATTLASSCYSNMFYGCSLIDELIIYYNDSLSPYFNSFLTNASSTGTLYYSGDDIESSYIPSGWNVETSPNTLPFYVEALEDNFEIMFDANGFGTGASIGAQYCIDDPEGTYIDYDMASYIPVSKGHKIFFKTTRNCLGNDKNYCHFVSKNNKQFNVGGRLLTLLNEEDEFLAMWCAARLFINQSGLISARNLIFPDVVGDIMFDYMFSNCTNLVKAPTLPVTVFANDSHDHNFCYNFMFTGCKKLKIAPELPATSISECCYQGMFSECDSLLVSPALPATTLKENSYFNMFFGCDNLTTVSYVSASILSYKSFMQTFVNCSKLVNTQGMLPAKELAEGCYQATFYGCTSLKKAPYLPATTLAPSCYTATFLGCSNLVDVQDVLPAMNMEEECYYCMFSDCSSLTKAPYLPALHLVKACYGGIFQRCTSLEYVEIAFETMDSGLEPYDVFESWVMGVPSDCKFKYSAKLSDEIIKNTFMYYDDNNGDLPTFARFATATEFFDSVTEMCLLDNKTNQDIIDAWNTSKELFLQIKASSITELAKINDPQGTYYTDDGRILIVEDILARYDFVLAKYGEDLGLDDFLERLPSQPSSSKISGFNNLLANNKGNTVSLIIVASIISISLISIITFIKKREDN